MRRTQSHYSAAMAGVTADVRYAHGCVMQAYLKLGSLEYGWFQDEDLDFLMKEPGT